MKNFHKFHFIPYLRKAEEITHLHFINQLKSLAMNRIETNKASDWIRNRSSRAEGENWPRGKTIETNGLCKRTRVTFRENVIILEAENINGGLDVYIS